MMKIVQKLQHFVSNIRFKLYKKFMMIFGYQSKHGDPLKCIYCKSKNLKDCNYDYLEHYIAEHDRICEDCGQVVGHWAYGYWEDII